MTVLIDKLKKHFMIKHTITVTHCSYRAMIQRRLDGVVSPPAAVVPIINEEEAPRRARFPPPFASLDTVFLCRKVYDFKLKRVLKNPAPS